MKPYSDWKDWKDKDWDTLVYAIRKNSCILMLGPDAAIGEGQERPLTEILAKELAEEIDLGDKENIDTWDLAQVAQCYCMSEGRQSLEARVSAFYEKRKNLCSDFHRDLAALPFYFTVTTTPDNMFIKALEKAGKKPLKKWYHFRGVNPRIVEEWSEGKPLVFYLYGTMDDQNSLLLTENDLLDYLVALISNNPPMPSNVRSELQDESKSFLFLGFGFRQWYLRILLHVLQGEKKGSPSVAMEHFNSKKTNPDQLRQTLLFFRRTDKKIKIFEQPFDKFAADLRKKFGQLSPVSKPPVKHENAPGVFICHSSIDKDSAASLYREFDAAGLKPWLDKENLRGGDDWNLKIKETLGNVDYFVVLQSQALARQHRGYVIKEINWALEKKTEFRRGIRFIIPVKIDDSPVLEELKDIQAIDLTDSRNVGQVIDTIIRDFKKRGSQ
jgi:hypothetical protein